jgi:hypothetical protein
MEEKLSIFNMHSKLNLRNNLTRAFFEQPQPEVRLGYETFVQLYGLNSKLGFNPIQPQVAAQCTKRTLTIHTNPPKAIMKPNLRKSLQTRAQSYNARVNQRQTTTRSKSTVFLHAISPSPTKK